MKYPAGNNGLVDEQVNYAYHPQMSLNSLLSSFPYAYVYGTSYDAAGRVKQRTLGGTTNQVQTLYNYYPWNTKGGRLEWMKSGTPSTQPADPIKFQHLTYDYDAVGNVGTIQDYKAGDPQTQSFTYDEIYRLRSAAATGGNGGVGDYGPESYSYESTTGRLASKNGMNYSYNTGHFHAVGSLSNGNTYSYDANGNMAQRYVSGQTYNLVYDAENHLASVSGAATASFTYDGDGKRIRVTITGGTDTVYIGNYFEWNVAASTLKKYYYAGATRVAMREGSGEPQWLLGDHLGSASKVVDYYGDELGGQGYKAWGETRMPTGQMPTEYQYTGQFNQTAIGLYYYNSRWYDPYLNRWTQPDSIIPEATQGVQAWDRYAYVNNNPLNYNDPTGHYGANVHYQLTYVIVLEVALEILSYQFSDAPDIIHSGIAEEWAEQIASGNNGIDRNPFTSPATILGDPSPSEYYHFASQSDAVTRLAGAVQNKDVSAFAAALHSYQDSFSHIESGFSLHSGQAGVDELLRKCPTCSQRFSEEEIYTRAQLTGHLGASETDNYNPNSTRDSMMESGTRGWVISFLLTYYEISALDYYSDQLGNEVQ